MGIMLVGGCPQPQQPTPASTQEPNTPTTGQQTGQSGLPERPIPGPVIEPNQPVTPPSGGETGGGGTGGGGAASFSVRWDAPLTAIAVRPGTPVNVEFKLSDTQGVVSSAELLVARDDNQDGKPDGDPVASSALTVSAGTNTNSYDTNQANALLSNKFGRFLLGVRLHSTLGEEQITYAPGRVTIDGEAPTATWLLPTTEALVNPTAWHIKLRTTDNSDHTVRVVLDNDTNPSNGYAGILVPDTTVGPGTADLDVSPALSIGSGTYYYYVIVSDGIDPPTAFYVQNPAPGGDPHLRLMVTNRLIGTFDLNRLDPANPQYQATGKSEGAIFQGFNFNDLAGSSMAGVPDLDGDGKYELLVGARFGKPNLNGFQGQGWGEAYMIYGGSERLHGMHYLNATGSSVPGVIFRGIRSKLNTDWSEGLSDITVIPDMDGDDLPELVFSFPRVESVTLGETSSYQHPLLMPDLAFMGEFEMRAVNNMTGAWIPQLAQFTRGGIVLVSSHNDMLRDRVVRTRRDDRVLDLQEVGQLFLGMERPGVAPFRRSIVDVTPQPGSPDYPPCTDCVANVWDATTQCPNTDPPTLCDPNNPENPDCPCKCTAGCDTCGDIQDNPKETAYTAKLVKWDVWLGYAGYPQGPGGFHMPWTIPAADPPLTNPTSFGLDLPLDKSECEGTDGCRITNMWFPWGLGCFPPTYIPRVDVSCINAWDADGAQVWTGFYGNLNGGGQPWFDVKGGVVIPPSSVGARILGESKNDRFGTAVSSDGTYLYISAPEHQALVADIPWLPNDRLDAGAVYMLRTTFRGSPTGKNLAQLWVEPGQSWPQPDAEIPTRLDYTMPTPHQYIIETVGSWRMDYISETFSGGEECIPDYTATVSSITSADYSPYPTGTAGYLVDRTSQVIGPHDGARLSFVRALGDVNGDGVRDFAVGSPDIQDPATGVTMGAIYVVYGRPVGFGGHLLLEDLQRAPNDPSRLAGVMLKGDDPGAPLARVFDDAGDFNGDGIDDVIVGSEAGSGGNGETIIILGSQTLESPADGWTIDGVVAAGRALRFVGKNGERLGANVAGLGDVDGDGYTDVLVAAPGADGGRGAVYLIYGSPTLSGDIVLADTVGTIALPGARFVGRNVTDALGGGSLAFSYQTNDMATFPYTVYSRGAVGLGDIDGDGKRDFAVSAMLANPDGRTHAGEVYILYGRGD
jgi:hypothetical protein